MADGKNRQIILVSRPRGEPTLENFKLAEAAIPAIHTGQILLKTKYLSLDPYMRGRMNEAKSYVPPFAIGEPLGGGTVSEVVASNNPQYAVGDIVLSFGGWQEYSVSSGHELHKLDPKAAPVSTALGVLGMPGLTAYGGLLNIGLPKPGETLVVAAAAGPVGSAVGQIGKIKGCRVVGIAGGQKKVDYLKAELGFDAAVDHRSPRLKEELKVACPEGIDIYFENVGGAVWDAVFPLLNNFARVPVCGLVANYNASVVAGGAGPLPLAHGGDPDEAAACPGLHSLRLRAPDGRVPERSLGVDRRGQAEIPGGYCRWPRKCSAGIHRASEGRKFRQAFGEGFRLGGCWPEVWRHPMGKP